MTMRARSVRVWLATLAWLLAVLGEARGQGLVLDQSPIFRVESGGPTNQVTGLAFSADGRSLFVAGQDKVVQAWSFDPASGSFRLDRRSTFRVPIGPGLDGAINAMALSNDGRWLAVGGVGPMRGSAGFRQPGEVLGLETLTKEARLDLGRISLFPTRGSEPPRSLVGNEGTVHALAFSSGPRPILASAAIEGNEAKDVVVRSWDAMTGKLLFTTPAFRSSRETITRPSMIVRQIGRGDPSESEIMLAWSDGPIRTWRFSAEQLRPVSEKKDAIYLALAGGSDPYRLITSSFLPDQGQGKLSAWSRPDVGEELTRPIFESKVEVGGKADVLPEALTLVTVPPSRVPDHAAVVVRSRSPDVSRFRYALQLFPLVGGLPPIPGPIDLGEVDRDNLSAPILAADPTGQFLAIAYKPDREVALFAIADLLKGVGNPRQTIRSPALAFAQAVFAHKGPLLGGDWGLMLEPAPKTRPGEQLRLASPGAVVFDLKAGTLATRVEEWTITGPAPDGRMVELQAGDARFPPSLVLKRPGAADVTIGLKSKDRVTDYALAPSPPAGGTRLLAVGLWRLPDGPKLEIYDAVTSTKIGELTGHTDVIRGLSFSGDGQWLLSTSNDRTVSAWDAAELAASSMDPTFKGVRFAQAEVGLVVRSVNLKDQPFLRDGDLLPGDIITSLFRGGRWDRVGTPRQLADAILETRPGENVTIGRGRGVQAPQAVTLVASRQVAERKPSLSISMIPDPAGTRPPHWLAWTPLGSYDLSDPTVEGLLGWHFNPSLPGSPVRFASSADYRDRRTPGLLRRQFLGDPVPSPQQPIRAESEVDPDPLDLGRPGPLRRPPIALRLRLRDPLPPIASVSTVEWTFDGGPASPMTLDQWPEWSASLAGCSPRAWHIARITLRTGEPTPRVFTFQERFRYVPEPPSILLDPASETVEGDRFDVSARIQGLSETRRLLARAWNRADAPPDFEAVEAGPYRKAVALRPGSNEVVVEARPEGLAANEASEETARATIRVVRTKASTPTITLAAEPVEGGSPALVARPGEPLAFEVGEPKVRVEGVIRGKTVNLTRATIQDGEGPARPLAGFVPGASSEFRFREMIDLSSELGTRLVRLDAQAGDSDKGELVLTVRYRPPVASIERIALDLAGPDVHDGPDGSPPRVDLSVVLRAIAGASRSKPSVVLNEVEVSTVFRDEPNGRLSASISPRPGRNEVRVRLRNDWGVEATSRPLVLWYKRPPIVTAVRARKVEGRPFADLTAEVASPEPLEVTSGLIRRERPTSSGPAKVEDVPVEVAIRPAGPGRFVLTARDLPIASGENRFLVLASNVDGWSVAPRRSEIIAYQEPPAHRLVARIIGPDRQSSQSTPSCSVKFKVQATGRLRKVKLVRLDESGHSKDLYGTDGRPIDSSLPHLEETVEVRLVKGLNTFTLTAVDDQDLRATDEVKVSYDPPPLRATIDALVVDGKKITPQIGEDGKPGFREPLGESWVTLHGTVEWPDQDVRRSSPEVTVTVLVNGTPWWRKPIKAEDGLSRRFETGLRLPTPRSLLTVQITGAAVDEKAAVGYVVACRPGSLRRRIHLLAVGVRPGDNPGKLRDEALAAFRGRLKNPSHNENEFESPAFEKGWLYGPLAGGTAYETRVLGELRKIRKQLDELKNDASEGPTDVVVVYYRGIENRSMSGRSLSLGGMGEEIRLDDIHRMFAGHRASQVFLLDVARDPKPKPSPGANDPPDFPDSLDSEPGQARPVRLRVSWLRPEGEPVTSDQLLGVLRWMTPAPSTIDELDKALQGHYRGRRSDLTYDPLIDWTQRGTILVGPP